MRSETPQSFFEGRYLIERFLAQGALAEVFLVRGPDGALRVLKRMHAHCSDDPTLVAMFEHEGRLLGALRHPGIPRVYDRGFEGRRPGMAIDFVEGVALDAVVPRAIGDGSAVALALGLLDVLDHVHACTTAEGEALRVVHRDVAPSNVLVSSEGAVALFDFGIATSVWRSDPDRGVMKGTRGYMAPEVVTGEREADARCDLWAMGVILYELLLGRRMFSGPPMRVLGAIAEAAYAAPSVVREGFPEGLATVLARALARSPDERFTSAREMSDALRSAAWDLSLDLSPVALALAIRAASGTVA